MPIHIEAKNGEVADKVILVGDPDRAKYIAENYLENAKLYNSYRHLYGYTGFYNGKIVSVQTSGMGSPSLTIVVEELNMLGVKEIVRLGTCGAISEKLSLGDTLIVTGSHSSHNICQRVFPYASFSAIPDFDHTVYLREIAYKKLDRKLVKYGTVLCSETFYEDNFELYRKFGEYGTLAVEMETYPLFFLGSKYGIKTSCILTVSDIVFEKKRAEKSVIKNSIDNNIKIVLDMFNSF